MFSTTLRTFGFDISDRSAKCIAMKSGFHGANEIDWFGSCDIPVGAIEGGELRDMEKVIFALEGMLKQIPGRTGRYAVVTLPESKTFIKVIEVAADERTLQQAIIEELPNHIPTPLEELIIDWQVNNEWEGRKMVTVGAVPKTVTEQYVTLLSALHLKPYAFEIEAQAIVRAILREEKKKTETKRWAYLMGSKGMQKIFKGNKKESARSPDPLAKLIVDLGATRTSLIMFDWHTIQFTSSVGISGIEVTKAIAEKLKLTEDEAERAKKICGLDEKKCKGVVANVLQGMLTGLALEIERAVSFYGTHFRRAHQVDEIVLTGGGASLIGADTFLASQLSTPVRLGNPLLHIGELNNKAAFPRKDALTFTTAIGLTLREFLE